MFRTIINVSQNQNNIEEHICNKISKEIPSVRDFYKGRNVFITGGTGFIGQCLVEKLLRSCPDIGYIYLPIRATEKGDSTERFERFKQLSVFDVLRKSSPDFGKKIIPLAASLENPNLGLPEDTFKMLTDEVSVIFHVAATIKLDPPIREVIESNVMVSTNVFRFGKQCKHLAAYVHTSTLYAHADLMNVEEKVYPTKWSHIELIEMVDKAKELKANARDVLGNSPCIYFASKKVGEYMTKLEMGSSPAAIIRPGKVSPSLREPAPGWSHGYASYIPWLTLVEKGHINIHLGTYDGQDEIIPVDLCVNSFINTAWYIGTKQNDVQKNDEPFVVNLHSSKLKHLTTEFVVSEVNKCLEECGRSTRVYLHPSRFRLSLRLFGPLLKQTVWAWLKRKKPLSLLLILFTFFNKGILNVQIKNNGKEYNNLDKINTSLNDADKIEFPIDLTEVDWSDYLRTWFLTLKEKRETRERTKRQRTKK